MQKLFACLALLIGLTTPLLADETDESKLRQQQEESREKYDKMRRQHEEEMRQFEEQQRRIRQLRRNRSPRPGTTGQGSESAL